MVATEFRDYGACKNPVDEAVDEYYEVLAFVRQAKALVPNIWAAVVAVLVILTVQCIFVARMVLWGFDCRVADEGGQSFIG